MTMLIAGFGDLGRQIALQRIRESQSEGSDASAPHPAIYALSRSAQQQEMPVGVQAIAADLTDPASLTVIPRGITELVYCASADASDPSSYQAIYVQGLRHVLTQVLSEQGDQSGADSPQLRVVFVSSTAVYARSMAGWVDEQTPTEPDRFNGTIMLQAEALCRQLVPQAQILRLSGIYGPGRTYLLRRLLTGSATIPADHDYWANRIHIEDAARAVLHLLRLVKQGDTFIGSDSHPTPLAQVYKDLARRIGAPEPQVGPPNAMMGKKRLSNRKLIESGFAFRWPDAREGYQTVIDEFLST